PPKYPDWESLERLERAALPGAGAQSSGKEKEAKKGAWLGRTFSSKDGWPILVGRSKDENLELTFKHARGNDLWLHVRGRPGAHTVVPVPSGKSVPLETLLDAALLTLYYSGGESWGKTEVDYTFKKHVKRIKDSSEASYTHNKTLILEMDAKRMERLLATL
ncbi:MAG: NFACT RNA binding domain-containing protein, partial [Bdellovibrionota bacterium]